MWPAIEQGTFILVGCEEGRGGSRLGLCKPNQQSGRVPRAGGLLVLHYFIFKGFLILFFRCMDVCLLVSRCIVCVPNALGG